MKTETYGKKGIIDLLLEKLKKRSGYIPVNMSQGLGKELKKMVGK